jgi:hypothetical protein
MDKCKEITFCTKELLKTHKIHIKEEHKNKIIALLSNYIELLIFNIVAIISIICLNMGIKKVLSDHMQYISKYVDKRCAFANKTNKTKKMSGGSAFNTAAFYGVTETCYSKDNDTSDLLKINFEGNIARNAIPITGGGSSTVNCIKLDKIIIKKIKKVFNFFDIKIEKNTIEIIKEKYDIIIKNLFEKIKNIKGELTTKKVDALIHKSKIMKK